MKVDVYVHNLVNMSDEEFRAQGIKIDRLEAIDKEHAEELRKYWLLEEEKRAVFGVLIA